jgi:hypothetical protein
VTPVDCFPSQNGAFDLRGNLWEWTTDDFVGYPNFEAFPYPEYSEEWFDGDHKVLRGGSWATSPEILRPTFRNFFRRAFRIAFAGVRLAENAWFYVNIYRGFWLMSPTRKDETELMPVENPLPFPSELDQPLWSVITFNECAASGLNYAEAKRLIEQMQDEVPGLCIVTDEAARKMYGEARVSARAKRNEPAEDLSQKAFQETL